MTLSIVYPVFNEEGMISHCIDQAVDLLKFHGGGEIIFVDDCSSDLSGIKIAELQKKGVPGGFPIKYVKNPSRIGCHGSVINGLISARGDYVLWFPSDLQVKPADAAQHIQLFDEFSVIHTFRINRDDPRFRILLGKIWSFFCRKITGLDVKDFDSVTFFSKEAINQIFKTDRPLVSSNTGNSAEILLRARIHTLGIIQVPIRHHARINGEAKAINIREAIYSIRDLIRLRLHYRGYLG